MSTGGKEPDHNRMPLTHSAGGQKNIVIQKQKNPSQEESFYKGQKGGLSETGFDW